MRREIAGERGRQSATAVAAAAAAAAAVLQVAMRRGVGGAARAARTAQSRVASPAPWSGLESGLESGSGVQGSRSGSRSKSGSGLRSESGPRFGWSRGRGWGWGFGERRSARGHCLLCSMKREHLQKGQRAQRGRGDGADGDVEGVGVTEGAGGAEGAEQVQSRCRAGAEQVQSRCSRCRAGAAGDVKGGGREAPATRVAAVKPVAPPPSPQPPSSVRSRVCAGCGELLARAAPQSANSGSWLSGVRITRLLLGRVRVQ